MISISKNSTKQTLRQYLLQYRSIFKKRSFDIFYWLIMSILCMEEVRSIKFIYDYFIKKHTDKVLNSIYYFLSYMKLDLNSLNLITVSIVLSLIPEKLKDSTIFITIDDTLEAKYGDKFECCSRLFDHSKKEKNKYINGHCFVCAVLNIPLYHDGRLEYLSLPVGYRLYSKDQSKLEIAAKLIDSIMLKLKDFQTILLCDSWYSKGVILDTIKKYDNLDIIGAVRYDTVMYDLPPAPTGKRGRPRTKGDKQDYKKFSYKPVGEYYIAEKQVITNLFKEPVYVTVTTKDTETFSSVRVYISSIDPEEINYFKYSETKEDVDQIKDNENPTKKQYKTILNKILDTYHLRWNIEVIFYQHKFFWSFGNYMVRNKNAIERYANLLSITYTFVCILPFIDQKFQNYQLESPQVIKRTVGSQITKELFLSSFVSSFESTENYNVLKQAVNSFIGKRLVS